MKYTLKIHKPFYLTLAKGSREHFWSQFVRCPSSLSSCKLFTFSSSSPAAVTCRYGVKLYQIFSRTTGPIPNKLGTEHSLVKGIQHCSNNGPCVFPITNSENTLTNFEIFLSRTSGPISFKFGKEHPWVKGIQVCSNKGPCLFLRGDNNKRGKIYWQN